MQGGLETDMRSKHSTDGRLIMAPLSYGNKQSSFPLTSAREISDPERSDLKSENIGLPVESQCPAFKRMTNEVLSILLPVICIVFGANQNRSCNGTLPACKARHSWKICDIRLSQPLLSMIVGLLRVLQ